MKDVWRFEANNGIGPNRNRTVSHSHCDRTPVPTKDGVSFLRNAVFGCSTRRKLLDWFSREDVKEMRIESNKDYRLIHFRVPAEFYRAGRKQVAFDRDKAILVKSWPVSAIRLYEVKR